jgi:hypothetical protein
MLFQSKQTGCSRVKIIKMGHNLRHSFQVEACNLLKVQSALEDSQSSNPGSIPGSATIPALPFHKSYVFHRAAASPAA